MSRWSIFSVDKLMVNVVVLKPRQSFFASAAIGNSVDLNRHKRIKQQSPYIYDIAGGTSATNALSLNLYDINLRVAIAFSNR